MIIVVSDRKMEPRVKQVDTRWCDRTGLNKPISYHQHQVGQVFHEEGYVDDGEVRWSEGRVMPMKLEQEETTVMLIFVQNRTSLVIGCAKRMP